MTIKHTAGGTRYEQHGTPMAEQIREAQEEKALLIAQLARKHDDRCRCGRSWDDCTYPYTGDCR